jgi:FkbH-like protein
MTGTSDETRIIEYQELLRPGRLLSCESRQILLHASRFSRIEKSFRELKSEQGQEQFRIAVLATLSTQHFISVLRLFLYSEGISPDFYVGEFDNIITDGTDPNAAILQSNPQALLILPAIDDIKTWPKLFSSDEEITTWVRFYTKHYLNIWQQIAKHIPGCRVYQSLFVPPFERPLGNLERRFPFSRTNCLTALNNYLVEQAPPYVTLVDVDALSGLIGRQHWIDETAYFTSKQPFSIREMPVVAAQLSRLMVASRGMVRKCLVLDLDNTLWGGVIGDDGINGIRLDPNDPVGESYLAFQRYLLSLKERGVLLAVCSKNDPTFARSVFEQHPDIILKLDDFAVFQANWNNKATNLRYIAQQLNIGIDSLVFFDDSPAERTLVRQFEPNVFVIETPENPALFIRALEMSFAFEWSELTQEDLERPLSYIQNNARHELRESLDDYDAYLRSLNMKIRVESSNKETLRRVCQLTNKTNQFNFRTNRYTEDELLCMINSGDHDLIQVRLSDCFTNYGIIASVILKYFKNIAFIENWVMSCRVFKRGVEDATYNEIISKARSRGVEWLVAEYIPTSKNGYISDLPERLSLLKWLQHADSPDMLDWVNKKDSYISKLSDIPQRSHFIEILEPTGSQK